MNKSVNQLKSELKSVIAGYLDLLVQRPAMEAVENDFELQDKLSDILILLKLVQQQVISFDPRRLDDVLVKAFEPVKPISEDTLSLNELFRLLPTQTRAKLEARTIYLSYLDQLFNWTVVSILSASYLSAFVLLRTLLELLVNASSEDTGGLRKRVAGGFNSNMCEAVVSMSQEKKPFEYAVHWSPKLKPAEDIENIAPVKLVERSYKYLDYAAKELRQLKPEYVTVVGRVTGLTSRDNPLGASTRRSVVVHGVFSSNVRPVDIIVELDKDDYVAANKAHLDWSTVEVSGIVSRSGNAWRLSEPHGFKTIR